MNLIAPIAAVLFAASAGSAFSHTLSDVSDEPVYYGRCMRLIIQPLQTTKLRPGEIALDSYADDAKPVANLDHAVLYEVLYVVPRVPREKARVHQSDGTFETYVVALGMPGTRSSAPPWPFASKPAGYVIRPIVYNWGGCF
jgi:hypothetical protein